MCIIRDTYLAIEHGNMKIKILSRFARNVMKQYIERKPFLCTNGIWVSGLRLKPPYVKDAMGWDIFLNFYTFREGFVSCAGELNIIIMQIHSAPTML